LCGRVLDATGEVIPGARISAGHTDGGVTRSVVSASDGRFCIVDLALGVYRVTIDAAGFRTEVIAVSLELGGTLLRDVQVGAVEQSEKVTVRGDLIGGSTAAASHVVDGGGVQDMPLNGRHVMDITVTVPGAVAPSQSGFSSRPSRGVGPVAVNIAGNREEAVAFLVNGVSVNNLTFGSLVYEPPISSVREVRVDSTTFAAEHGHVSGAIVNISTRSGTNQFRGDVFGQLRNDALDARNFFEPATGPPQQLQRQHFGGSVGGPILRGRTFFFASYEGIRHEQDVTMNSLVPSDAQRAGVTNPVIQRLLPLIPPANAIASDGTSRFVGSAPAIFDSDRWTLDFRHEIAANHRLHVFKGSQRLHVQEPASQGNSVPGFGSVRRPSHGIFTLTLEQARGAAIVHEARIGRSRLDGGTFPAAMFNPADYGIDNGVTRAIGLPQIAVAGDLNFGGPAILPQGRFDSSWVFADVVSVARGRHGLRFGGEYRHFINDNFFEGTGMFNFPSLDAFLSASANAFSITLGERRSVIDQRAVAAFVQDRFQVSDTLTLELGLRYEWHVTPTEREGRFVIFDVATSSLRPANRIYRQNNLNLEPRLALAWDPGSSGRSVLHAAYARTVDQPGTTAVRDTAGNPPFATPLTAGGSISLDSAIDRAMAGGLAPVTIDPDFRNAGLHAWTVRLQQQVTPATAITVGYRGSKGADLRISRNINQPVNGVRPFPRVANTSPIAPGRMLANITQVESTGFSNYHGAWIAMAQRQWRGLQFDASYTWSRSLDTNSLNSSGFALQDAYDIAGEYGPSDFDARHRAVFKAIYDLPFTGHALTRNWQVAVVVQSQSGNPVNIVTSTSSLNGVPNTVRPDLTGPIRILGSADRWFDPSAFVAVNRFGNLGRNAVVGPGYYATDLSISKQVPTIGRGGLLFRIEVFNVFNQVNLGPPGNIVGSPTFGKITRTRFATGETGSSRQVQLTAKVAF
jgi:hypothetical protein